jgi:hypothetical protein
LDRRSGRQLRDRVCHEGIERCGLEAEADRLADRQPVVEDLRDLVAADGEVDADGAFRHGVLLLLRNRAPTGTARYVIRGRPANSPGRHNRVTLALVGAAGPG